MSNRKKEREVHAWRRIAIKRLSQVGEHFAKSPKNLIITSLLQKHNIVIDESEYIKKPLESGDIVKQPKIPATKNKKVKSNVSSEGGKQLIVMPYEEYIRSTHWYELRKQALERDGYRCRFCNSKENLNVHHRYYPKRFGEWSEDCLDALTTFCEKHHALLHGKEPKTVNVSVSIST